MTPKQKRFCLEYAQTGNGTESAKRAGYSPKTAYQTANELIKKPEIQRELQRLADEYASAKIANIKEIQEFLTSVIRQQKEEEVIVVEGCGDGISEAVTKKKKPSLKDAVKASEVLARMQGGLNTTAQLNVVVPIFGGEEDLED